MRYIMEIRALPGTGHPPSHVPTANAFVFRPETPKKDHILTLAWDTTNTIAPNVIASPQVIVDIVASVVANGNAL